MSRTLRAHGRASRAVLAGAVAFALTVLAAVGLSSQANAAFTTPECLGEKILGRGASFAQAAHGAWEIPFRTTYCGSGPDITYDPAGSGAGVNGMKLRGAADPRFGGTDDPLKAAQKNEINAGTAAAGDEGLIHQIPIAVGAVAPLVNFPNGCDPANLPPEAQTPNQDLDGDLTMDDVIRVKFTKKQWEEIWAQNSGSTGVTGDPAPYVEWHKMFTSLAGTAACEKPIVRVVRFDNSGTTFAFKDYLSRIKPNRGWLTTYESGGNGNREWPGAVFGPREDCPKVSGAFPSGPGADTTDPNSPGPDNLTSACSGNATNLVAALIKFDGSVGYADIASARAGGLAIKPESNDNDTFWTQLPNGAGDFEEPTFDDERGFRDEALAQKGANCTATEFENVPDSTLDEWGQTTGVDSAVGYGLCTLTYAMAFDDNADAYGALPAALEEARARTVKDYLSYIVTDGQDLLFGNDYTALPLDIQQIAFEGVDSIEWQKGEGGGGKEDTDPGDNTKKDSGTTLPPPPAKPSNAFSLLRKSISSKTGGATISVKLPGAGKLELVATAKNGKKTIKVASATLNAGQAGTFNVPLRPSGAAKKALRKKGKLTVKLALTFTPTGGDANGSTSSLTLKLKKASR